MLAVKVSTTYPSLIKQTRLALCGTDFMHPFSVTLELVPQKKLVKTSELSGKVNNYLFAQ